MNNLRQIGLAVNSYQEAHSAYPIQGPLVHDGISFLTRLLPYMEQTVLYNQINFNAIHDVELSPPNSTIVNTKLQFFMCPDDPGFSENLAQTSYDGNWGLEPLTSRGDGIFAFEMGNYLYKGQKVSLYKGQKVSGLVPVTLKPRDVTDGLSQTAVVSESLVGAVWGTSDAARRTIYQIESSNTDRAALAAQCHALDIRNLPPGTMKNPDQGRSWIVPADTLYDHVLAPNDHKCRFSVPLADPPSFQSPSSQHPGGVNVTFLDGHVQFIKDSISLATWRALGTRNGGEVISADAY